MPSGRLGRISGKWSEGEGELTQELQKLTKRELARIKELVQGDKKLSAAFQLAARLAKGDAGFRGEANRVARDFVMNRRALGKALPTSGIGKGKKSLTLRDFGIDHNISHFAKLLAGIDDDVLESELTRMEQFPE